MISSQVSEMKRVVPMIIVALALGMVMGLPQYHTIDRNNKTTAESDIFSFSPNLSEMPCPTSGRGNMVSVNRTVDSLGNIELFSSIALDGNNRPHIAYYKGWPDGDLHYAFWNGFSWQTEMVDSYGTAGYNLSLALDNNGRPHISYCETTGYDLKYAHHDGNGWLIDTVDSNGWVGGHTSIAIDSNNHPHISYHKLGEEDNIDEQLKYAYNDGNVWHNETVDSRDDVGWHTSIAIDSNDKPHISYYDATNHDLKYSYLDGAEWYNETVDSQGDVGTYSSIVLDQNDFPSICYYDGVPNNDLKYADYKGVQWIIDTVDIGGDVGWDSSVSLDANDTPHISYYDGFPNRDLKHAHHGGGRWHTETVDSKGDVGRGCSMVVDGNNISQISYLNADNCSLKYATVVENEPPVVEDRTGAILSKRKKDIITFMVNFTDTKYTPSVRCEVIIDGGVGLEMTWDEDNDLNYSAGELFEYGWNATAGDHSYKIKGSDGIASVYTDLTSFYVSDLASGEGRVSGTVLNASSSLPLAGATVTITNKSSGAVTSKTTGTDGKYSAILPLGDYTIGVESAGYWSSMGNFLLTATNFEKVKDFKLTPETIEEPIFGSLEGYVKTLDENNMVTYLGGANVILKGTGDIIYHDDSENGTGLYKIYKIPVGWYQLTVTLNGYEKITDNITIFEGANRRDFTLELIPDNGNGDPYQTNYTVVIIIQQWDAEVFVNMEPLDIDTSGIYRVRFLPGQYLITAHKDGYADFEKIITVPDDIRVEINLEHSGGSGVIKRMSIVGPVKDMNGNPLEGVELQFDYMNKTYYTLTSKDGFAEFTQFNVDTPENTTIPLYTVIRGRKEGYFSKTWYHGESIPHFELYTEDYYFRLGPIIDEDKNPVKGVIISFNYNGVNYQGVSDSMGMVIIENLTSIALPKGTKITATKDNHRVVWESGDPLVYDVEEEGKEYDLGTDHIILLIFGIIAVSSIAVLLILFVLRKRSRDKQKTLENSSEIDALGRIKPV